MKLIAFILLMASTAGLGQFHNSDDSVYFNKYGIQMETSNGSSYAVQAKYLTPQGLIISDTIFLDADWIQTSNRGEAKYYRGAWYHLSDSTWLVNDFFLDTRTIQMVGIYSQKIKPQNQIGEFRYYYSNGNLRAVYNFRRGVMNGTSTLYYENGNKEVERKFADGKLTDTVRLFYENGAPREIRKINTDFDAENYAESEKQYHLIAFWSEYGVQQITNGNGIKIDYYPNGQKRQSIEYSNGFPNGEWIQYNEKKKVISKMIFKNGKFISGQMYPKRRNDIFASLYRAPRFPGGLKALDEFVNKNTGRCTDDIQSAEITVMISVTENGKASYEQVLSGEISNCQFEELEEMIRKMPDWTPAIRYGRYVESTHVLRVKY